MVYEEHAEDFCFFRGNQKILTGFYNAGANPGGAPEARAPLDPRF